MAIVKCIKGDLIRMFKSMQFQAIGHGANCRNLMGAGIAAHIAQNFPSAYDADTEMYKRMGGGFHHPRPALAGNVSVAHTEFGEVYNMYTQVNTGPDAQYQLLQRACENLNKFCKQRQIVRVGLPLIGCGIGGLDISAALTIIGACTPDIDVTIVVLENDQKSWREVCLYKNYSFPRKFDSVAVRTGPGTFKLYSNKTGKWSETGVDLEETAAMLHQGEVSVSFSERAVGVNLLVKVESDLEANIDRLY